MQCHGSSANHHSGNAIPSFGRANQSQAMKMVADREAKALASGDDEDASYSSADVQDLPKPPYYFKVWCFEERKQWMSYPRPLRRPTTRCQPDIESVVWLCRTYQAPTSLDPSVALHAIDRTLDVLCARAAPIPGGLIDKLLTKVPSL